MQGTGGLAMDHDDRSRGRAGGTPSSGQHSTSPHAGVPGKTTLTAQLPPVQRKAALDGRAVQMRARDAQSASEVSGSVIQRRETSTGVSLESGTAQDIAAHGVRGSAQPLPFQDRI